MKKVIILAVLFMACLTTIKAQVFFSGSFGAGTTGKSPAGALTIGLDANRWLVAAGFHTHLSAKNPRVFRLTAGRSLPVGELSNINVTGGVANIGLHSENKTIIQPKGTWLASVEYAKDFRGKGEWFVECTQAGKKFNFVTVGLKYFFKPNQKRGCPSTWGR
jgi:hypothetical protein